MADKLIFPIGFDLEAAVKEAQGNADKYIRQIESAMNRKPIVLKAEVDASKFQVFSRQFSNSIDGISAKLAQAQRLWNAMTFDVKFDADGNLSRRAQIVFDSFQQLTQASATMGQRLGEVNRSLAKSEADTAKLITAEYDKRKRQIDDQIKLKERQAAAEERVRQGQLKGVNVGYVETQKQVEAVRNLRLQYEAILPTLNTMAQKRVNIRVEIDKQFEADVNRVNAEIARLRQSNLQLGSKGDINAIQANLTAIRQLESELARINQQKIDIFNNNKIQGDLARLRSEIASVFGDLQTAERKLASDNSLNAALDAQSQKVLKLHSDIQRLDQQIAQLNAQGKMYNADGSFSTQAISILQQRIALTKQLEQEAVTGQQAQIKLEQQLREEKRRTEQETKNAAKEAERQAKAEAQARKQAIDAANAENKARQAAYNARARQGKETQRILKAEENSIANITAKLQVQQQRLQSANFGSAKFNKIAEEVKRLTQELDKANKKMRDLTGATTTAASKQSAAVRQVTNELKNQDGYISRLLKRMAVYAGFSAISNFLTNVRQVTAEFELQKVSLGAIIQDQARANQLFSEIKAFALKSPVSILDLTKYTKQLAAYKIGVDELFETTKKLTDVSVGLGVSMDRVVLAYGQTRATGYLRASEIRQFTEMGVPIVEELAAKLSKMNGELVTAAQVMDMVSKRAISFELVKEVFDDMTSAGGMFYNMQEKQGNTLYGLWAKLGDAASVMYDEIGNTEFVNSAMRTVIQALTDLMKHWRFWGKLIIWGSGLYLASIVVMKSHRAALALHTAAGLRNAAAMKAQVTAAEQTVVATRTAGRWTQWSARLSLAHARAQYQAATATNVFSKSLYSLKAAFLSNPLGMVILGVTALIALFADADDSAKQLSQNLSEIEEKYTLKSLNDADNFKRLANAAVKAANGSKEQTEKLKELDRTYGEIVGSENLQIDKLRVMNGEYQSLIDTIEEYNVKMKFSEREGAIKEYYGGKKKKAYGDLEEEIATLGVGKEELGRTVAAAMTAKLQTILLEELEKTGEATMKTAREFLTEQWINAFIAKGYSEDTAKAYAKSQVERLSDVNYWYGQTSEELDKYVEALNAEHIALEENNNAMEEASGALGRLNKEIRIAKEELEELNHMNLGGFAREFSGFEEGLAIFGLAKLTNYLKERGIFGGEKLEFKLFDPDSFLAQQASINSAMKRAADIIRNSDEYEDALGEKAAELEPMWLHLVDSVSEKDLMDVTTINFDAILEIVGDKSPELVRRIKAVQKEWGNLAPTSATALQIRQRLVEVSESFDPTLKKMKRFLWDGSGAVDEYLKRLKEQQEELKKQLKEKQTTLLKMGKMSAAWSKFLGNDISAEIAELENEIAALDELIPFVTEYTNPKDKGKKSDDRLSQLNEIEQTLTKINQKYEELLKKEGDTKALEHIQEIYGDTLKYINQLGEKFKLNFAMPTDFKSLQDYRKAILDVIETLKMKGYEKAAIELQAKIGTGDVDQLSKQIEQKLKDLSDKISRTKTAKEFYEKILSQTGDVNVAATLTMNVYGNAGEDLFQQTVEQIQTYFSGVEIDLPINFDTQQIDYKALRKLAEKMRTELGEDAYKGVISIADNAEKDTQKMIEGWLKATEKAKTYSDKLLDLARTTQTEINKITLKKGEAETRITELLGLGDLDADQQKELDSLRSFLAMADNLIQGFKDKQAKEQTSLAYEAFKDSPMYVQMFDDLDNASTRMLENMKTRMEALKSEWKNLTPAQIKELQSRMNEIDNQLARRNPFSTLTKAIKKYRDYMKNGEGDGKTKSAKEAENLLMTTTKAADEARKKYDELIKKYGEGSETSVKEVIDAKKELDRAMANEAAAQKAVENWKKVKDAIGLSANELFQMLNWAGDIAKAVADISEALGADEEDVQYWNTIADSLGEITGGIQDIVSAAMSGNVVGIISSVITAIPKMFVGFVNLFYAGRIRNANKEIKKQAELLEQLEYTYSRLEKTAEKLFGAEYIANYNQQLKILNAQASAYQKQLDAEKSKGKKADKEKLKDYENSVRDTMNEIEDMQSQLIERFTGTSRHDVAKQMAQSWLEARASMSDTFAAIKSDYADMIKNMVVEGAAARVIEKALSPMWEQMDAMLKDNNINGAIDALVGGMDSALNAANNGMEVLWKALEARGYDMKQLIGDVDENYTGIKRDIAGASEETMSNVATIGNTLMYYVSPIPGIAANVSLLTQHIVNGNAGAVPTANAGVDFAAYHTESLQHLNTLTVRTSEILAECKELNSQTKTIADALGRVVVYKGNSHGIKVYM